MTQEARDAQLCKYIIRHSENIEKSLEGINSLNDFVQNETDQKSILFDLLQIGENINKLSDSFKCKYKDIEYRNIVNLRNLIVHGYADVNIEKIYEYATKDVVKLKERIKEII